MTKIVAITGTHGAGKTTLSFCLAMHYKQLGANVKIIQEVARSCPFPLNDKMTKETALWIYHEHAKKELEALRTHDVVICDRTVFDSFVYAESLGISISGDIVDQSKTHLNSYDKLYFVRPDLPIVEDGVRSVDLDFQGKIDGLFERHLKGITYVELKSSFIFDKEHTWKQYC
jgi:thymidylate kinase